MVTCVNNMGARQLEKTAAPPSLHLRMRTCDHPAMRIQLWSLDGMKTKQIMK